MCLMSEGKVYIVAPTIDEGKYAVRNRLHDDSGSSKYVYVIRSNYRRRLLGVNGEKALVYFGSGFKGSWADINLELSLRKMQVEFL